MFFLDLFMEDLHDIIMELIDRKEAFIGAPFMIEKPDDPIVTEINGLWCEFYQDFIRKSENCLEPMSSWSYPVLDKVDYIDVKTNPSYPEDYEMKAFLMTDIYWRQLIRDILPPNSGGVVIVFEHEFSKEQFTYQVDGPNARFLGGGDKHDPKYDQMRISREIFDLGDFRMGSSKYFGVPVYRSENYTYTISVYPSDEMKSRKCDNLAIFFVD